MQAGKSTLRDALRERRRQFIQAHGGQKGQSIAEIFSSSPLAAELAAGSVVAGYWPLADEADVRPLLEGLHSRGVICVLPVVVAAGQPLVFREWQPGLTLDRGPLGTRHPPARMAERSPGMVLTPLVAFDRKGWRLGQGGGYYDRTLAGLRREGAATAVGIALSCQEVAEVPHGPHDRRLDWIVTEQEVFEAVTE